MVNRITFIGKRVALWLILIVLGAILSACSQNTPAPIVDIIPQQGSASLATTPIPPPSTVATASTPEPSYSLPAVVQPSLNATPAPQSAAKKSAKKVSAKTTATPQKATPAKPPAPPSSKPVATPPAAVPPPPAATPAPTTGPIPTASASTIVSTTTPPAARSADGLSWQWPMALPLKYTVASDQGIDIVGTVDQPIYAASSGSVVYLGPGVFGYGQMLMIQHNNLYLSVYANIDKSLVQQNDSVQLGQKIALLGKSPQGAVVLHFEIRKDGDPVDPTAYLPVISGNN